MARTYLQVAVFKPSMAREFSQAAVDELKTLIPAILTTAGSYLLSDWVARKLNLPEGSRPDPGAFVDMIRQAPIAPAKIATAGGGEMIIPPESLATWKRSVALSEARRVSDEKSAREALRDVLRRKGVQV